MKAVSDYHSPSIAASFRDTGSRMEFMKFFSFCSEIVLKCSILYTGSKEPNSRRYWYVSVAKGVLKMWILEILTKKSDFAQNVRNP